MADDIERRRRAVVFDAQGVEVVGMVELLQSNRPQTALWGVLLRVIVEIQLPAGYVQIGAEYSLYFSQSLA